MSDTITVKLQNVENNVISTMLARANGIDGFLNRVAYPLIIQMQRNRWATQNEGGWKPLTEKYAKYKRRKFASYPGAGTKMMVATSQLVNAVTGDDQTYHRKIVQDGTLTIAIAEESGSKKSRQSKKRSKKIAGFVDAEIPTFDYAKYANEQRNFTQIDDVTVEAISEALTKYLTGGDE